MTEEFIERDDEMIRVFRYRPESSVFLKTARQSVAILDTVLFGRTLFLDGILQSAEKDEDIYHRLLVHPVMPSQKEKLNVLVLGGGEGATLREVLKWKNVANVTMIDWDEELVDYFRTKEPTWHKGSFNDPRVTLEFRDVFTLLNEHRKYDIILVDLVDPDLEDSRWKQLFEHLLTWLEPFGAMNVNSGGVFPWDMGNVPAIYDILEKSIQATGISYQLSKAKKFVPSFGREWAFVILKKTA
jgi:spermidine synthase